jgi:hypothetical protein
MASPTNRSFWLNVLLALTVLLSAWLLFQVQPIVAKRILPWFGGGSAIWTANMLFFQAALFFGYLYAHIATGRLSTSRQIALHVVLLAAAAVLLFIVPVVPIDAWRPTGSEHPTAKIVTILAACVGLPYLMLAATAPLVQVWFSRANPGRSPYRLYALSNVGSLGALVTYPLVVEPQIGLVRQGVVWSALFVVFALACAASGLLSLRASQQPAEFMPRAELSPPVDERSAGLRYFFWLSLPACAVVLLLAVTSYLCEDMAPIPLLWIVPMVVYLLTFILSFDSDRWYRRTVWFPLAAVASFTAVYTWYKHDELTLAWHLSVNLTLLLSLGMVCHGELARMRPSASRLTSFYLCIAGGGALGGLFAGAVAPQLFTDHYERDLSVLAAWLLALAALATDRKSRFYDPKGWPLAGLATMALLLIALAVSMYNVAVFERTGAVAFARNFYGALKVHLVAAGTPDEMYTLTNGRITHGTQFRLELNRRVPTAYFHANSGIGQILAAHDPASPRRVGIVGLGVGTLAAYAEAGETFQFYEINPQVIEFADKYFTFLEDARQRGARIARIEGDARISLERAEPQNFDVLVLDAFSGDAIPVHLLTVEAFQLYLRHVKKPDGVLAVHISNLHLHLTPVIQAAAERYGLEGAYVGRYKDDTPATATSAWVLLNRRKGYFAERDIGSPLNESLGFGPPITWTDDYSNLLQILSE